ncbi:DUF3375 family protein [Streptomyces sp. NPDC005773]|uniref:DUF3375 family protein n=1 Tax=Streptomyces sp. NPDC005773 TaxID=3364727 RepID=UPI00368EC454
MYVDSARLTAAVHQALGSRTQVSLAETLREHPLEQGLAELVAYLALPDDGFTTVFDDQRQEEIAWPSEEAVQQVATVPVVTFARTSPGIAWASSSKEGR